MEEECQARAFSTQSPSEGLTYPLSLWSRPLPLLRDAFVPVPDLCWRSLNSPNPRAIGGLLKLHPSQGLLIISVINGRGLKVCLSTQINPDILEYLSKEAIVGEYSGRALTAGYHMHHHQIPYMNSSPHQNGIHYESLKIGDLVSMSTSQQ